MAAPASAMTSQFLLSAGTIMVGPSAKVFELDPATHSVGLVKAVQIQNDPQFVEMTQGIDAQVVFSVNTSNQTRVSADVQELTAKNMAYAAGLDAATGYAPLSVETTLSAAITTGGASVALTSATGIASGDWIVLYETGGSDRLHAAKVASVASNTVTLAAGYTLPTTGPNAAWAVATTSVIKVNNIPLGTTIQRPTFGVKIVGIMPATGEPVTLIFPKVRITKGLAFAFNTDQFTSMPYEFTPYALLPSDPYYADFGSGLKTGMLLKKS